MSQEKKEKVGYEDNTYYIFFVPNFLHYNKKWYKSLDYDSKTSNNKWIKQMITKDIAEKLEESIKNIGGAIDESTPYMDNYCHQINFKINEKEYTIDLTDMDIVNTYTYDV